MTTDPIFQESAVILSARTILDYIDEIKNTQIGKIELQKLRNSFDTLSEACNSKLLRIFPIKITHESTDKIGFEIRSTYLPRLKFSDIPRFVIDSIRLAESNMDDTRCLDALCVLIDYCNVVVYSRSDHGLELEPKKIDEWNSSSMKSTQLVNGDDTCIT